MTDTSMSSPQAAASADVSSAPAFDNQPSSDSSDANDQQANAEPEVEPWRKVKHKYKAAGEIVEVDYDELVRRAQKADGAEKRLAEAARKEKEIQGKIEKLRTLDDVTEIIDLMGGDERARPLLEKFLWDKIQAEEQEAKLSPEERDARRRAAEAEKKAKEAQDKLDALNKAAEENNKAAVTNKANEIINKEISDAIAEAEAAGLSPEDVPYMIEQLLDGMVVHLEYLEDCEEAGIAPSKSPLSPRDVLRKIQDKETKRTQAMLKKLTAKDLRAMLTDEQLEGLRRSEIEALTAPSTQNRATLKKPKSDTAVDPFTQAKDQKKKPNTKDWFAAMDQRYRNGR